MESSRLRKLSRQARFRTHWAAPCKLEQRGGFRGCRRCRRSIVGWYEWGAGESWDIVLTYSMILSCHEAGLTCSEVGLRLKREYVLI